MLLHFIMHAQLRNVIYINTSASEINLYTTKMSMSNKLPKNCYKNIRTAAIKSNNKTLNKKKIHERTIHVLFLLLNIKE